MESYIPQRSILNLYYTKFQTGQSRPGPWRDMWVVADSVEQAVAKAKEYAAQVMNHENPESIVKEQTDKYKPESFDIIEVKLEKVGVVI